MPIYKWQGSTDGNIWTDVTADITESSTHPNTNNNYIDSFTTTGVYKYYRLLGVGGTSATVDETYYNRIYELEPQFSADFNLNLYPKSTCTDNADGTDGNNHQDLDSDGDGCSDAYESGATTDSTVGQFTSMAGTTTDMNRDGLPDVVDTDDNSIPGYSMLPYAYTSTLNLCADFDNDGIRDLFDIDDDNDGILDAEESPNCFYTADEFSIVDVTTSLTNYSTNSSYSFTELYDGVLNSIASYGAVNTEITGETVYQIEMSIPVELSGVKVYYQYKIFENGAIYKWQGSTDGNIWIDVTADITESSTHPNTSNNYIDSFTTPGVYKYYRLLGVGGTSATVDETYYNRIYELEPQFSTDFNLNLYPKSTCTDNADGTDGNNHQDLDSDGDGCSDSYEAGAITTEVTGNMHQFTTVAGEATDSNRDGLPDVVDTDDNSIPDYSMLPFAYDSTLNLCIDFDSDGVGDLVDIDDDNDGILDAVESPNCFYSTDEFSIVDVTTSLTNYNANSAYSFAELYDGVLDDRATYGALNTEITGEIVYQIEMNIPVELSGVKVYYNFKIFEDGAIYKWQGSTDGDTWTDVTTDITESTAHPNFNSNYTDSFTTPGVYKYYRLLGVGGTSATVDETFYNIIYELEPQFSTDFNSSLYPRTVCTVDGSNNQDVDSDSLLNHQDLDSDGDGCSDALEGGEELGYGDTELTLTLDGGNIGTSSGPVQRNLGNTIDENGLPTIVGGGQSLGNSQDDSVLSTNCYDLDKDGLNDYVDLDDDNDGILDAEENQITVFTGGTASQSSSISNPNCPSSTCSASLARDGNTSGVFTDGTVTHTQTENNPWWLLNMNSTQTVNNIILHNRNGAMNRLDNFVLEILDASNTVLYTYNHGTATLVNTVPDINIAGNKIRIRLVGSSRILSLAEVIVNVGDYKDTDNDGLFNHQDLDSDGDGCPDAIEGGGIMVNSQLETSTLDGGNIGGSFSGNTGTSPVQTNLGDVVNTNGIPIIITGGTTTGAETVGQSIGFSQDKDSSSICTDTDGDEVNDYVDLDDDNDGILDTDEGYVCVVLPTAIDLSQITSDATGNSLNYTFPNFLTYDIASPLTITSSFVNGSSSSSDLLQGDVNGHIRFGGSVDDDSGIPNYTKGDQITFNFSKPVYVQIQAQIAGNSLGNFDGMGGSGGTGDEVNFTATGGFTLEDTANEILIQSATSNTLEIRPRDDISFNSSQGVWAIDTNERVSSITIQGDGNSALNVRVMVKEEMCAHVDTDNDGIENYLDLDSDGDGCPDTIEAGVAGALTSGDIINGDGTTNTTTTTKNAVTVAPYGANGLANDLEDVDTDAATTTGAYTSTYDTYALDVNTNVCGVAMITQVYQSGTDKWIEVTNAHASNIVAPNAANITLFKDASGTQTDVSPTDFATNAMAIAPGASYLVKHSSSTISNIQGSSLSNDGVTDFEGEDDILVLSRASNNKAWSSRVDVIESIKDTTAYVRIDEVLQPNTTHTSSEWVAFVNDALDPYRDLAGGGPERHPHTPLLSGIASANTEANILLGLHRFNPTVRTGSAWDNGYPDRSRHVQVAEDYNHTVARLSARKLQVKDSSKLAVTDQLLVVSDSIKLTTVNDELRLVGASQLVQTHEGASTVTGQGKLLVDQNSTVASIYRYNYLSSPVNTIGANTYSIETVLKDGTTATNATGVINTDIAKDITFVEGYDGKIATDSVFIADYWIYTYASSSDGRSNWSQKGKSGAIPATDGFIMKGPGVAQNYTFMGTAKDGDLTTSIGGGESYLVGNPFASAISAKKFIEDNLASTTATLYFWQHVGEEDTETTDSSGHNYAGYIGGYATRNISTGVAANSPSLVSDFNIDLQAESAFIQGFVVNEDGVDVVLLNEIGNFVEFKEIIKGVDSLRIGYKSAEEKDIAIQVDGVEKKIVTLPVSVDYSVYSVEICVEAASNVKIVSNDTNSLYVDYLKLQDADGNISCAPKAGGSTASLEPGPYIPIAQGFFIQGSVGGGAVVFDNSQREFKTEGAGTSVFFRGESKAKTSSLKAQSSSTALPIIKLGMDFINEQGKSIRRHLAVSFNKYNSFEHEKGYDSELSDLGATDIYWKFANNIPYVIAGIQEATEELEVPLEIVMSHSGSIIIQIEEIEGVDKEVFIKDNITEKYYVLNNTMVTLQLEEGVHENRFSLTFKSKEDVIISEEDEIKIITEESITEEVVVKNALEEENIVEEYLDVFVNKEEKELVIQNRGSAIINYVELFNLLGQKIKHWRRIENQTENRLDLYDISDQVYILNIVTDKGVFSKKVVVKK